MYKFESYVLQMFEMPQVNKSKRKSNIEIKFNIGLYFYNNY